MIMLSSLPFEDAGLSLDLVVDAVSIRSISVGDSSFLGGRFCGVLGSWIAPETSFFFSSELDCSQVGTVVVACCCFVSNSPLTLSAVAALTAVRVHLWPDLVKNVFLDL